MDSGVRPGQEVTPYYDPLLAKVIAHAPDRRGAIATLDRALARSDLVVESKHGRRATNLEFLRHVLSFCSGDYDTLLVDELLG